MSTERMKLIFSAIALLFSLFVLWQTISVYNGIKKYYPGMCGIKDCVCYGRSHYEGKQIRYDLNEIDTTFVVCSINSCDTFTILKAKK